MGNMIDRVEVKLKSGKTALVQGDPGLIGRVFTQADENINRGKLVTITRRAIRNVARETAWLRAGVMVIADTSDDSQPDVDGELALADVVDQSHVETGRVIELRRGDYKSIMFRGIGENELADALPGKVLTVEKMAVEHITEISESIPRDEAA